MIGVILAVTAFWLAVETKSLLIGESAEPELVQSVNNILNAHPMIVEVNEVLTLHMGPEFILVTISADFKNDVMAVDVEKAIQSMSRDIKNKHPLVKRIFIEAEDKNQSDEV
jgi:divalent metal cation (Fe/Co/Zn/Cd) transporter